MANRPLGYGYTAETTKKMEAKYDDEAEQEALQWIDAVVGGRELAGVRGVQNTQNALKDGIMLCKCTMMVCFIWRDNAEMLMNAISPGSVPKIHPANANKFKHMENISNFLAAAEKYGVDRGDLFQSVYLAEGQNMAAVIGGIHSLGRKAQTKGFRGAVLGPRESEKNPREFTEEQLRKGRAQLHD